MYSFMGTNHTQLITAVSDATERPEPCVYWTSVTYYTWQYRVTEIKKQVLMIELVYVCHSSSSIRSSLHRITYSSVLRQDLNVTSNIHGLTSLK